jgi:hypothetical protein
VRLLLVACVVLLPVTAAGCGGSQDTAPPPATTVQGGATGSGAESTSGASKEQSLENEPFNLIFENQAVPPDFRAAYERGSPIVVQFFKQNGRSFYPQGLGVDSIVDDSIGQLKDQYPDVEFFSYDIDDPGAAKNSGDLELGQYGTLAAQLQVSLTPYVALLAPRGGEYVYETVFVGYVTQPVLDQALADLANIQTTGSDEDTQLLLEQAETGDGGELRSVTIGNEADSEADLGGYELTAVNPSTGEADPGSGSLSVDGETLVDAGGSVSLGQTPDVKDTEGNRVDGTFGGGSLSLGPGDQLALVGPDGAVAATFTL